jgi:hypothetical protein
MWKGIILYFFLIITVVISRFTLKYLQSNHAVVDVIKSLNYDFNRFGMKHFIRHVSDHHGKVIIPRVMDCYEGLFGVWFAEETADYICINNSLHPTHKIHIILHEIAHILLNHPRVPLAHVLSPNIVKEFGWEEVEGYATLAPQKNLLKMPHEHESEAFAFHIQELVFAAHRWHELTANDSSIEALLPIINSTVN